MSLQPFYVPSVRPQQAKADTAKRSFEDYPDEDPGFALDGALGGWPGADDPGGMDLDVFPPDEEPRIERSSGPKAVPAKDKPVATVKASSGKGGKGRGGR